MKIYGTLALLALTVWRAAAIPPPEFGFVDSGNHTELSVGFTFNNKVTVVQEGQLFGGNITQQEPALALDPSMYSSVAEYTGKYIVVMVDPDAPSPDNPTSRFILHWLAADVEQNATATSPQTGRALSVPQTAAVPYRAPGPPPTSSAHRYILYAFAQPSNFTMPAAFRAFNNTNRAGFQLDQFITAAGLARPMAGEYFYVSRQSAVPGDFMAAAGGEFPGGNGNAVFAGKGSSSGNQTSTTPVTAAAPPHMPGVEFAVSLFAISMLGFFLFA